AGFREAIGFFWIHDRPGFIESIDERAVFGRGTALPRTAPHAEASVPRAQPRFQLSHELGMEALFDDVPLVGREIMDRRPQTFAMDHLAVPPTAMWGQSTNSPTSSTPRG